MLEGYTEDQQQYIRSITLASGAIKMEADKLSVGNVSLLPSSTTTHSDLDRAEQVVTDYVQPAICVFGILCNVLNLIILTRPRLKESPYTYLLGLAVADLGALLMVFVRTVISQRHGEGVFAWQFYNGYIFLPFANIFSNTSVWITVFLTMERWISVTFPLRAKKICTRRLARRVILCIVVVIFIINVPRFFCRRIIKEEDPEDGKISYSTFSSDFEQSDLYRGITWMYIIFIHAIPCLTLIVLNTCLLYIVYKANRSRADLNETNKTTNIAVYISRAQRRLTITCVSIICLFLICVIPTAFSNPPVAYALFGKGKQPEEFFQESLYRLLRKVTNTLLTCNLSLNFILYCLFNHKFYKTLHHVFRVFIYHACKIKIPEKHLNNLSKSSTSEHEQKIALIESNKTVTFRKQHRQQIIIVDDKNRDACAIRTSVSYPIIPSTSCSLMPCMQCSMLHQTQASHSSCLLYNTEGGGGGGNVIEPGKSSHSAHSAHNAHT